MESQRGIEGERRVAADQWDVDGWHILAAEAEKVSLDDAQPIYERLVAQFPPLGKFWRAYVEHYVREKPDDHQQIIAIYERAVKDATTSIDLWKSYLAFSTSLAVKVPGSKLEADAISVHERALKSAGLDMNSHPLWAHYIDFIKKHTSFSDSQRRDALRRVYQRSVGYFILIPFSKNTIFSICPLSGNTTLCMNTACTANCYLNEKRTTSLRDTVLFNVLCALFRMVDLSHDPVFSSVVDSSLACVSCCFCTYCLSTKQSCRFMRGSFAVDYSFNLVHNHPVRATY